MQAGGGDGDGAATLPGGFRLVPRAGEELAVLEEPVAPLSPTAVAHRWVAVSVVTAWAPPKGRVCSVIQLPFEFTNQNKSTFKEATFSAHSQKTPP